MKIAVAGATGEVGRHVAAAALEDGHSVVELARSRGIDLTTAVGLAEALTGVNAVIDVSGMQTMATEVAVTFFTSVTNHLLEAERAAGVGHHVALSIVGIDGADSGYYAGKLAQERLIAASSVPWTVLRATQFHEFAAQTLPRGTFGPLAMLPIGTLQPVAAREVGRMLVDLAVAGPVGRAPDLAGPRRESLPDMGRRYLRARGRRTPVLAITAPTAMFRALRRGEMLPGPDAVVGTQTYEEWLAEVR